MNQDFAWLKWVGFFVVVSILGAFFYLFLNDKSKTLQANLEIQQPEDERQYNEKLDQASIAIHDAQAEVQRTKENPPIYESMSLEQTIKFIGRLEQLMAEDSKVNLDYLPDVAAQSRRYNALIEEAETVYGKNDIANPLRYCTAMVSYAREIWGLKYSKTSNTQEYKEKTQNRFLESYHDAKKACLDDV